MKFIVDKMPEKPCDCPFHDWKYNPPFIEEPGYYYCKLTNSSCELHKNECNILKPLVKEIISEGFY